ncbi:MAG TPA: hypothetical protein P5543_09710 [Planctomycetota bacterium]|nr:hypothetical protein [Planctomycetota bacterium]
MRASIFLLLLFFISIASLLATPSFLFDQEYQILSANEHGVYMYVSEQIYYWKKDNVWEELSSLPSVLSELWKKIDLQKDMACIDEEGNLWLLFFPQLVCYNLKRKNWQIILLPIDVLQSHELGLDFGIETWQREIWIATRDFLWCFHQNNQWWEQIPYPDGVTGGILQKDSHNCLWLSGFVAFDGKNWKVLTNPGKVDSFDVDSFGQPWVICENDVWTWNKEMCQWQNLSHGKFSRLYSIALFKNRFWISNYDDGCYFYDGNDWEKVEILHIRPSLSFLRRFFNSYDILWFNTYFGIGYFDGSAWVSQQDITDFYKMKTLYYLVMTFIILILCMNLIFFILFGFKKSIKD